jgi:hypothetical protein
MVGLLTGLGSNMGLVWIGGNVFYELAGWGGLGLLHMLVGMGVDVHRCTRGSLLAPNPSRP